MKKSFVWLVTVKYCMQCKKAMTLQLSKMIYLRMSKFCNSFYFTNAMTVRLIQTRCFSSNGLDVNLRRYLDSKWKIESYIGLGSQILQEPDPASGSVRFGLTLILFSNQVGSRVVSGLSLGLALLGRVQVGPILLFKRKTWLFFRLKKNYTFEY